MRGHMFAGVVLVILGLIFLLNNLDIRIFRYVWPSALVVVGIYFIFRAIRKQSGGSWSWDSDSSLIGDDLHTNFSGEIDGTNISHFIGDTELNLSGGTLKPGINKMSISSFIGDIRLNVPKEWAVEVAGSSFIGCHLLIERKQDGIFTSSRFKTAEYDGAEKKLSLSCSTFIGDIKVRQG